MQPPMPTGWFKAEDIRKMHTYREAIRGVPVRMPSRWRRLGALSRDRDGFFDEDRGRIRGLPEDPASCGGWARFRWRLANRASNLLGY